MSGLDDITAFLGGKPMRGTGRVSDYFGPAPDLSYLYPSPQSTEQRVPVIQGFAPQPPNQAAADEQQAFGKLRSLNPADPDYGRNVITILSQHPLAEQSPLIRHHLDLVSRYSPQPEFNQWNIHDPELRSQFMDRAKSGMNWKENQAKYEEDLGYKNNALKLKASGLPLPSNGKATDEYVADIMGKISHLKPMAEKERNELGTMVDSVDRVSHDDVLNWLQENTHKSKGFTQEELDDAQANIKYQRSKAVQDHLQRAANAGIAIDPRDAERFKVEVPHLNYKKGVIESPPVPKDKTIEVPSVPKRGNTTVDDEEIKPWQEKLSQMAFNSLADKMGFRQVMDNIVPKPSPKEGGGYDVNEYNRWVNDTDSALKSMVVNNLPNMDSRIAGVITKKLSNPNTKVSFHDLMGFINAMESRSQGGLLPMPKEFQKEFLEKESRYLSAVEGDHVPQSEIDAYKITHKKATDDQAKEALKQEYTQDMKDFSRVAAHNFWVMDDNLMSHLGIKRPGYKVQVGKNKVYQLIKDTDPELASQISSDEKPTPQGLTQIADVKKFDPNRTFEENQRLYQTSEADKNISKDWGDAGKKLEDDLLKGLKKEFPGFNEDALQSVYRSIINNERTVKKKMSLGDEDPYENWAEHALSLIDVDPFGNAKDKYGLNATSWLGASKSNLDLIKALAQERIARPRTTGNIGKPIEVSQGTATPVGIEKREDGGPIETGKPYLVGEKGPEVVVPQQIPQSTEFNLGSLYDVGHKGASLQDQNGFRFSLRQGQPYSNSAHPELEGVILKDIKTNPSRKESYATISRGGKDFHVFFPNVNGEELLQHQQLHQAIDSHPAKELVEFYSGDRDMPPNHKEAKDLLDKMKSGKASLEDKKRLRETLDKVQKEDDEMDHTGSLPRGRPLPYEEDDESKERVDGVVKNLFEGKKVEDVVQDPLQHESLMQAIAEEFGIDIPDSVAEKLKTQDSIARYINQLTWDKYQKHIQ